MSADDTERLVEIEFVLSKGANVDIPDKHGRTPLMLCAMLGHAKIVSHLLKAGALIKLRDAKGATPLTLASRKKHMKASTP